MSQSDPPVSGFPNSAGGHPYNPTFGPALPQQSHVQNDPFAALLSAVVQDATNSSRLQFPNSSTTSASSQSGKISNSHTTTASLAQMLEQQQKQLSGNVFRNQQLLQFQQAQLGQSHAASASPSMYHYPPYSSPDQLAYTASSEISRQPQLPSRNMKPQNAADFRSPSALTSGSNITLHDSACAYASGRSSRSGASSVVQTPSPLLDASASDHVPHEIRVGWASSTDVADCPAKKVTKGDCHDHAHVRGQPVLHVCHWQNCHASFTTVQSLLHHISQSHLGLNMGAESSEESHPAPGPVEDRVQTDVNFAQNTPGTASTNDGLNRASAAQSFQDAQQKIDISNNPGTSSILDNMLGSAAQNLNASSQSASARTNNQQFAGLLDPAMFQHYSNAAANHTDAQFASSQGTNMDDSLGLQFHTASQQPATTRFPMDGANAANSGPMACLWDDCPPFDPFAHFGQQCLDDTCVLPPSDVGNATSNSLSADQPVDTRMLTCDPTCDQDHTHLFPCEPACSQVHTHVYPMHLHSYSPAHPSHPHNVQLDSATAVLKHLLQQHLGVDLTQGLLNVASQQLDDLSAIPQSNNTHVSATSSAPVTRRPSTEKHACSGAQRKCKPLRALPSKAVEDAVVDSQTHACRWHGCAETFGSVEDLTEHLSDVHVGKGKTEYECLWAGCETCEAGQGEDGGQILKGRKFTTRQKVMRHMQVSIHNPCLYP